MRGFYFVQHRLPGFGKLRGLRFLVWLKPEAQSLEPKATPAITAVTLKPELPLTLTAPPPYILKRGSYERYS